MSEPVLVVHGVGNRSPEVFAQTVGELSRKLGGRWRLIPAFWGDLGAIAADAILDTLPDIQRVETRDGAPEADSLEAEIDPQLIASLLGGEVREGTVRADGSRQEPLILRGLIRAQEDAGAEPVHGRDDVEEIQEALQRALPRTRYLREIQDPIVLDLVGRVLGAALTESATTSQGLGGDLVRSADDDDSLSGTRYGRQRGKELVSNVVAEVDRLLGTALGKALGRANQNVRERFIEDVVSFVGDIFVYQRNRQAIHRRLWDVIEREAPGYGTDNHPISVLAHSLGGVITFDLALDPTRPLWIDALITFGSQPSFFHVIDPREELAVYTRGSPVPLPPTIRRWTNLWEPMDVLAFITHKVFRLRSAADLEDLPVSTAASLLVQKTGWTHSSYWTSAELVRAIGITLGPPPAT